MNKQTSPRRSTLENRAERLGLKLSTAGRHARYEAASRGDDLPRWELSDGKYQDSIRGFRTLAEVAQALDEAETMEDYNDNRWLTFKQALDLAIDDQGFQYKVEKVEVED